MAVRGCRLTIVVETLVIIQTRMRTMLGTSQPDSANMFASDGTPGPERRNGTECSVRDRKINGNEG
jgi:hypothetical protein